MINEMQGMQNSGLGIFCVFLAYLIAMLFAITFHEFAHAYVAHKCGDDTAKYMGRMTLNPFKHMDFLGAIMFIFFGFGWAKPVPINPNKFRKRLVLGVCCGDYCKHNFGDCFVIYCFLVCKN